MDSIFGRLDWPRDGGEEKQEVALNKAFLLFDANNSGDISEDEMVQIIRAAVDFKPDNDQLKEMMDKFRSNDTPSESSTRSSANFC